MKISKTEKFNNQRDMHGRRNNMNTQVIVIAILSLMMLYGMYSYHGLSSKLMHTEEQVSRLRHSRDSALAELQVLSEKFERGKNSLLSLRTESKKNSESLKDEIKSLVADHKKEQVKKESETKGLQANLQELQSSFDNLKKEHTQIQTDNQKIIDKHTEEFNKYKLEKGKAIQNLTVQLAYANRQFSELKNIQAHDTKEKNKEKETSEPHKKNVLSTAVPVTQISDASSQISTKTASHHVDDVILQSQKLLDKEAAMSVANLSSTESVNASLKLSEINKKQFPHIDAPGQVPAPQKQIKLSDLHNRRGLGMSNEDQHDILLDNDKKKEAMKNLDQQANQVHAPMRNSLNKLKLARLKQLREARQPIPNSKDERKIVLNKEEKRHVDEEAPDNQKNGEHGLDDMEKEEEDAALEQDLAQNQKKRNHLPGRGAPRQREYPDARENEG